MAMISCRLSGDGFQYGFRLAGNKQQLYGWRPDQPKSPKEHPSDPVVLIDLFYD